MTLEVNKPKDDDPEMRQKGRIYVCDLAGTEPAGDIFYASYKKIKYPDGTIEHKLLGPHKDQRLTKNLQSQGKKINLSLSEMAQFFMKMAQAIKKKKLKPGKSIPGCNSYFLCKYLKDIMLQARTYLFCAIRPEATYLNYTFSTLGFAKNASVIKLNPKKATTAATPGERKLMKQLDEMKLMMEQLKTKRSTPGERRRRRWWRRRRRGSCGTAKKNWKSNRQKKLSCRSVRKKRCSVPKSWKPESKNSRRAAAAAVVVKVAAAAAAVPTQPRWL